MKTYRSTAVTVGVLYIIGTLAGILSLVVTQDLLTGEQLAANIAENPSRLNLGAFLVMIMGLSLAAMPIFLFPIFKHKNEALAMGMVVFRGPLEGSTYLLVVVNWLLLSAVGREYGSLNGDSSHLEPIAQFLVGVSTVIGPVLTVVFIIGSMFLYVLFYLTRLIPVWLSVWGLVGALIYLAVDVVKFFGIEVEADILYVPLAIQEMVMALWLIIRGFDRASLKSLGL